MSANDIYTVADVVAEQIQQTLSRKGRVIAAIDGRCAAGKTTLAEILQEKLSCAVIHMDDFFLRPEQRTKERLAEPGGNVDYERFSEEVMLPCQKGEDFFYRPYDCHSQTLKEPVEVKSKPITIIEGAYACHPHFYENYDVHIFLDVDKETQLSRIRLRNGEMAAERFENLWIPLEETYISAFDIKEKCEWQYCI